MVSFYTRKYNKAILKPQQRIKNCEKNTNGVLTILLASSIINLWLNHNNLQKRGIKAMAMSLAAARVNVKLTQDQVCKALKMSKSTLSNYESYKTSPGIGRATQLAELYVCSLDEIKWSDEE
jgi:DNA-binding XRE family transcriptional regulator